MHETDSTPPEASPSRLGLALSGGGFRAAFFHLGVLARMAELDLLRRVEVLSTVSGGSVIGTMYYLKVRNLLQERRDHKIECKDYVKIVGELEREFYDGVKRNLRTRTFANVRGNWRMYSPSYSRSDRIAELYTEYLFGPLVGCDILPAIPLRQTVIQPFGEAPKFHPFNSINGRTANDGRRNKVPVLLLNATTLNTGHNFRFTSTWMGEAPTQGSRQEIDQNTRLRRAKFSDADLPEKYRNLPLGIAVAASTAVPGVFHPLALTDLYEGWIPQLVDGGVHDNQGIEGLLDNDCTHLIVSDACGQMKGAPDPSTRTLSVLKRSNSVMMDRIREEMYETACLRKKCKQLQELDFLHLRQDLEQPELTWKGGIPRTQTVQGVGGTTSYGVDKGIQMLLSGIRTDLDSFSEVEAQALMADGYLIAKCRIESSLATVPDPSCPADTHNGTCRWGFLRVQPHLANPNLDSLFRRQLAISERIAFKVFERFRWLKYAVIVMGVLLAGTPFCYMVCNAANNSLGFSTVLKECLKTYRALEWTVLAILLYVALFLLTGRKRWGTMLRDFLRRLALGAGAVTIASTAAWLHILVFDRLYLWQGRVARLKGISKDPVDKG